MSAADGFAHFDDFSVPEGSPLCYAYWVRAYDQAGNLYDGDSGCPRPGEYRCGRLLERTPPPVPVMTGLRGGNHGVLVEWVASPTQDLRAFHVYRSDKEMDPPQFLACVFTDGTVSATRWGRDEAVVCRCPSRRGSARRTWLLPRHGGRTASRLFGYRVSRSTGWATRAKGRRSERSHRRRRSCTRPTYL